MASQAPAKTSIPDSSVSLVFPPRAQLSSRQLAVTNRLPETGEQNRLKGKNISNLCRGSV
jgi:hypothetical protein